MTLIDARPILYVGDIHGDVDVVDAIDRFAIRHDIRTVVQVGDFGVRWGPSDKLFRYFDKRARQLARRRIAPTWYTCGGNHDNWSAWNRLYVGEGDCVTLAPKVFYVLRGRTIPLEGLLHLFFGGAESSDKNGRLDLGIPPRIEGVDWWREETPSSVEFARFEYNLSSRAIDVVVTHDAPLETGTFRHADRYDQPTCLMLTKAISESSRRPPAWFFGHHHNHGHVDIVGSGGAMTTYFGCGLEGQGYVLDVPRWPRTAPVSRFAEKVDACPENLSRRENRRWV